MKKAVLMVMVLALVFAGAQTALAQGTDTKAAKKQASKPGGIVVDAITTTATVNAIDAEKRLVTLKLPDGRTQAYKLGPEVKNFDQIKVGDQVKATFIESVALFVRKSGEKPSASEVQTVEVAPKGAKPGVVVTDTVEITAKVEGIDYTKRTVTLKGPQGNVRTIAVDKSVKRLRDVKKGDEVVARITEAVALYVEKP